MGEIENAMVVDWWWNESDYGVPSKSRLKSYEEAEREDREDEYII